ncbi:hypothetical protein [Gracilibacillus sp. YIM 98692]|uniref:hypothetical protein n=1 Tax=Gracilibacillus sp. YIM 98692 TaxID=2663532 RepID=UPI0013D26015|nr:hypothetical protein [Gracilibacillus sp. YIM 98692]
MEISLSFSLEGEAVETQKVAFALTILAYGTILFQSSKIGKKDSTLKTVEMHRHMLNEWKQMLEIDF